jgi:branched-chain amino acid transport system permease protein
MTVARVVKWVPAGIAIVILAILPAISSEYFTKAIGVKSMWLGIAAASLIFLAGYGGMVSLAQTALYGIAGFVMGNLIAADGGVEHNHLFGLSLGDNWGAWWGAIGGIVVATIVGLFFGAIAARSYGIYFLMLTLALGVLAYYFFAQVEQLSGFGGINSIRPPHLVGNPDTHVDRLYYTALIVSAFVYVLIRYVVRTPFGIALQGIRDDPIRMRSLGYNVALHRALAFGLGAFVASMGGVLSVWYNTQISPGSIDLTRTIDVLAIAVVGGIFSLEGAWVGAFAFTLVDYAVKRWLPDLQIFGGSFNGIQRFETWFGIIFLVIILLSPGGLMGLWTLLTQRVLRALSARPPAGTPAVEGLVTLGGTEPEEGASAE